MKENHYFY